MKLICPKCRNLVELTSEDHCPHCQVPVPPSQPAVPEERPADSGHVEEAYFPPPPGRLVLGWLLLGGWVTYLGFIIFGAPENTRFGRSRGSLLNWLASTLGHDLMGGILLFLGALMLLKGLVGLVRRLND
jgi:hypothetical protein